ncbi:T4S1 protein, partial [Caloenas nicobarica]|nr:T4S1 protein [Caloenas nicobarica]
MCTGKCSKCIGITLFPLAACAIVSNILLYFPNGRVLQLSEITDLVWFFHGILGAGILVILPAFMMLGAGGAGCCANRCGGNAEEELDLRRPWAGAESSMLLSVVLAVLGFAGGAYCAVISSLGLIGGPLCDTGDGEYLYPFRNDTLEDNYLFNQTTWSICKEPENIILWNIVLFSILLAIGVIEAILCFIQIINGLTGFICGTCMRKRK